MGVGGVWGIGWVCDGGGGRIRTCDIQLTGPKTIRPKKFEKITKKKLFDFF